MNETPTTSPAANGYRGCPAPRPMGGLCKRPLDDGAEHCHEHEGTDPTRRCTAMLSASAGRTPCACWPLRGLPFCGSHDPARVEYRRLERVSVQARLGQARHLIASASPEIRVQCLEMLVMSGVVNLGDLERVLHRYRVPSSWSVVSATRPRAPGRAARA